MSIANLVLDYDELLERLSETDSMLLALDRQLESWGHRAVVNVNGCRKRNAKYLEQSNV